MTNCIETTNLTYSFSDGGVILHKLNLQIPSGSIYGFLGPNGAGKTTTLKLILGLLGNTEGSISIFNKSMRKHRIEILKDIGSLIESPSLYSHLTAYENLKVWQHVYQCPSDRIEEVLAIVGLSDVGTKKAGQFSLGMKQRLSIAIALLHAPRLLILDEPTNGLDPAGILETRELLIRLNAELGVTIVISSHLLSEIEKLVTHVGIINKGVLLFQGTLNDLQIKQNQASYLIIETDNDAKTMDVLKSMGYSPLLLNGQVALSNAGKKTIALVNAELVARHVEVYQLAYLKNDLESIFLDLTKN